MTTREVILNLLRSGPKTSWELTQGAKTSRYGGRIMELRRKGYDIRHSIHSLLRADGETVVQHVYELVSEPTSESIMHEKVIRPLVESAAESIAGEKVRAKFIK